MRILVLGGTYFLGKAFVNIACEDNEITILNRGNRAVRYGCPGHIKKIKADRHNLTKGSLSQCDFDVAVDFCAYEKGDIEQIFEALEGRISQYIFISTCDVYKRGTGSVTDEDGCFETRDFKGAEGAYILGKAALENELKECAGKYDVKYCSIRPAFIYGPDNYAFREGIFFNWIDKVGQIIYPKDATGSFQMAYVDDVAKAILKTCGNADCYDRAFNICGKDIVTYESFSEALAYATGRSFDKTMLLVEEILEKQIPLPFPLTSSESETYTTKNAGLLGIEYTTLGEGLKITYRKLKEAEIFKKIDELFDANKPGEALNYMLDELGKSKEASDDETSLKLLNELIGYYRQTSEADRLLEVIEASLELAKKMGLEGSIDFATTALNCANAYRSIGKTDEAKKYYDIAEKIYDEHISQGKLDADDMLAAGLYNNISLLYQELSDYQKAQGYLKKALRIVTENQAGFEIAVTYANLANTALLAKQYEDARSYADTAIRLFKARGLRDPHYCAALSALGTCCFETGNIRHAREIFGEALRIVEETFGKNSQYERLKINCERCDEILAGRIMNGMELSKSYYREYGAKMIHDKFPEYENQIAVGLVGKGSDCFGYDDELSADHDFGPDFCMWLNDKTYDEIGEALKGAYYELPDTFFGFKRDVTDRGRGRRGVFRISDFYKSFLGTDKYEDIDFTNVKEYSLAACVNGEVFRDDEGSFTKMRNRLKEGFPENIRLLKLAEDAAGFSQCGQYNYGRMLKRDDTLTAGVMLSDCMKHAMKLYHHILNVYPPHDKWLYKSTASLPGGREVTLLLDKIMNKFLSDDDKSSVSGAVEELGVFFAGKLYERNDISDMDAYLDHHTEELIFKASVACLSEEELVDRIVKLEFEAFDKVKNEGGRAYCQNDWPTFSVMRKSQYLTWNRTMLMQYLYDFTREYRRGHNLITEKYGRMMESTAPERYEEFKEQFPELSEEKKAVIEQIVGIQMKMMEALAEVHPKVAMNARKLHTYEDSIVDTSYETYLRGEISTYSDKMLQLYGGYVVTAAREGRNIAYMTIENTAKLYGYESIEELE